MMTKEKAVEVVLGRCLSLARRIKKNESRRKMTDVYDRRYLGAFRTLLVEVGYDENLLPEEPYLDPGHEANYQKWSREKNESTTSNIIIVED